MSYSPSKSSDHVKRGLARLLQQYKGKPRFEGLLRSYLNRIQELEDAIWEVILYRLLEDAEGAQLDAIGKIVGRGRGPLNYADPEYLLAIRGQIRINRSCGTPPDMIDVATLTLPVGHDFNYGEAYPAAVVITCLEPETDPVINILFDSLFRTKPGGVRLYLISSYTDSDHSFTCSPYETPYASVTQGFSDWFSPGTGGFLATVLSAE